MLRKMYDWAMRVAAHPRALWGLAGISFAESSFFPLPPDIVVVPMVLARRDQAWLIATICTLSSVAGGILGYYIGYALYESLGHWLIQLYGLQGKMDDFHLWFDKWGLWVILIKGLTPIPYKLVTITSGVAQFNLAMFIAASVVTRGARFFLIAGLLKAYGEPVRHFIEKRLELVMTAFLVCLVGGFFALKYIG